MNEKEFLKYIVIIVVILALVFLSQQPYFREYGKNLYFQAKAQLKVYWLVYWTKLTHWFKDNIYSPVYSVVSREVEQKSTVLQQEINKQKNKIVQDIWEKVKNYFANIFSKISGTAVQ
jgi:hypothetical protein